MTEHQFVKFDRGLIYTVEIVPINTKSVSATDMWVSAQGTDNRRGRLIELLSHPAQDTHLSARLRGHRSANGVPNGEHNLGLRVCDTGSFIIEILEGVSNWQLGCGAYIRRVWR